MTPPELSGPYVGREGKIYRPHPDLVTAANVALLLEQPLLLTGEPGCGKTDFAWAAASALAHALRHPDDAHKVPLQCYVRSDTRARDLLYHYDSLGRFGDVHGHPERARQVRNYLRLEPLGEALLSERRRVVLIDEIDKAPRDLPNDLLRELDQGDFDIPEIPLTDAAVAQGPQGPLGRHMRRRRELPRPLVIITSNAERQLPDPFLRRCVFFHIPFPTKKEMAEIVTLHIDPGGLLERALGVFYGLRERGNLIKNPTTIELIGWMRALLLLKEREPSRLAHLDDLVRGVSAGGPLGKLPWDRLPALGCLIKLREDLDGLTAGAR